MKKNLLLLLFPFLLGACAPKEGKTTYVDNMDKYKDYQQDSYTPKTLDEEKLTVSFYYNFGTEEINLNSGMYATGTSTCLKIDKIDKMQ